MGLFRRRRELRPEAIGAELSLIDVPVDCEVEVARLDVTDEGKVHRLAALGILPGARLRLIQKRAAFLAVIEHDQVAFDVRVARCVWVRHPTESSAMTVDSEMRDDGSPER